LGLKTRILENINDKTELLSTHVSLVRNLQLSVEIPSEICSDFRLY